MLNNFWGGCDMFGSRDTPAPTASGPGVSLLLSKYSLGMLPIQSLCTLKLGKGEEKTGRISHTLFTNLMAKLVLRRGGLVNA